MINILYVPATLNTYQAILKTGLTLNGAYAGPVVVDIPTKCGIVTLIIAKIGEA